MKILARRGKYRAEKDRTGIDGKGGFKNHQKYIHIYIFQKINVEQTDSDDGFGDRRLVHGDIRLDT